MRYPFGQDLNGYFYLYKNIAYVILWLKISNAYYNMNSLQGSSLTVLCISKPSGISFRYFRFEITSDMMKRMNYFTVVIYQEEVSMTNKLQQYFPMIQTEEEVLSEINSRSHLKQMYEEWEEEEQRGFLDFVTGAKGVKMMYDFISKEILNPEIYKERVEEFISLLLGQNVKILEVLPNEETGLSDGYSILIMDIVVELENGSIVNLEIQKNGYMFPGERSACYSADLLLRQYRRVRMKNKEEGQKKKSCYRDIKDVYTIVLFETSPSELHRFRDRYLHYFEQTSDSGAKMNLLQKYLFVALDNFRSIKHNESSKMVINNRLEAWLAFMCMDDPDDILRIIESCPDFKEMYEQIYDICRNLDGVMRMFSKELQELDRNSVELMVDEMQKDLDKTREKLVETKEQLNEKDQQLEMKNKKIEEQNEQMVLLRKELENMKKLYEGDK